MANIAIQIAAEGAAAAEELATTARLAYRRLVWDDPAFPAFFRDATPIAELSSLRLGSRPAARGRAAGPAPAISDLRAIPWVFAWGQVRLELPGWYGLGAGLEGYLARHGESGLERLRSLYRRWPPTRCPTVYAATIYRSPMSRAVPTS